MGVCLAVSLCPPPLTLALSRRHTLRIPTHPAPTHPPHPVLPAATLTPHFPPPHPPTTIPPTPAPHTTHAKDNTEWVCVWRGRGGRGSVLWGEQGVWGCMWCVPQGGASVRAGRETQPGRGQHSARACVGWCVCVAWVCLSEVRIGEGAGRDTARQRTTHSVCVCVCLCVCVCVCLCVCLEFYTLF